MGLGELARRHAKTLSGGEARRVALARALVTEPEALLLDEPFNGVDDPARERLVGEIRAGVRAAERTLVLVTQRRDEALRLRDPTDCLVAGRGPAEVSRPNRGGAGSSRRHRRRALPGPGQRPRGARGRRRRRRRRDGRSARRRAARGAAVAAPAAGAGGLGGLQPRAGRAARTVLRGRGRVAAQHRAGRAWRRWCAREGRVQVGARRRLHRGRPEHRRRGDPLGGRKEAGAAARGSRSRWCSRRPRCTSSRPERAHSSAAGGWWRVRAIARHPRSTHAAATPVRLSAAREAATIGPRQSQPDGPAGGGRRRPGSASACWPTQPWPIRSESAPRSARSWPASSESTRRQRRGRRGMADPASMAATNDDRDRCGAEILRRRGAHRLRGVVPAVELRRLHGGRAHAHVRQLRGIGAATLVGRCGALVQRHELRAPSR